MKYLDEAGAQREAVLARLSALPRKILELLDHQVVTELVFHELCGDHCFGLKRAAYIVDNPDFDCCRGIVGFDAEESSADIEEGWRDPLQFEQRVKSLPFNQKVRDLSYASVSKNNSDYVVKELGRQLGIVDPAVRSWRIKNGNYGLLLFEHENDASHAGMELLDNGLSILGFCPLF
ncbi:MAG: hypothetical protein JW725_04150 [Candidatus Babeliaceae bacterium]|nr:hypothetical protein [Candidatus Babeliaceae bacterium]